MSWVENVLVLSVSLVIGMVSVTLIRSRRSNRRDIQLHRAEDELHPILKEFTNYRCFKTNIATYPRIRTFYRPHTHKDKHADIQSLPLLIFIHGLGGVLPQFAGVIGSLSNIAPCFGIELPGHGRSSFAPREYEAYSIEAYALLWKVAIETICSENGHGKVVLIGHSMGCSLAALLASTESKSCRLSVEVAGLIAVSPRARNLTDRQARQMHRFFKLPDLLISMFRWFDRLGGEDSASVRRVVGDSNELDLKSIQLGWNRQFPTAVFRRESLGLLSSVVKDGQPRGNYPSRAVWTGVPCPLFLIGGASDTVCSPGEVSLIVTYMTGKERVDDETAHDNECDRFDATNGLHPTTIHVGKQVVQTTVFPSPAAHALLYAHATYRLVSALIEAFLHDHISEKLDFSYQLKLLTTNGKWDVKNLEKWRKVLPVSAPIHVSEHPNGLFRALKTMRAQDEEHDADRFVEKWAKKVYAVVDISHDAPVYDFNTLEKGGIEYHKFPTVSKIPPTPIEVQEFCALIDKLVAEKLAKNDSRSIGVHCHYGYNRTGFFLASYLITRKHYGIQQALDEFAKAKPPGIRHDHFIDTLWLRYSSWQSNEERRRPPRPIKNSRLQVPKPENDDLNDLTDGDVM